MSIGHLCSFLVVFPVLWTPVSAEIPENQARKYFNCNDGVSFINFSAFFIAFLALISAFFTVFGCQFLGLIYFGIRLGREKARTSILAQDEKYLLGLEDALISRVKTLKEEVEEEKTVCQKMMVIFELNLNHCNQQLKRLTRFAVIPRHLDLIACLEIGGKRPQGQRGDHQKDRGDLEQRIEKAEFAI